jgi:hypothetical protein
MDTPTRPAALTALVSLVLALRADPAQAQANPALPVPGVHQVGLLLIPAVQKELKLEPGQVEGAKALAVKVRDKMLAGFKGIETLEIADRVRKLEEVNKGLDAETKAGLDSLLKDDQRKRLRQISLQDRSGMAFGDAEVQDALKMSDAQKARVQSFVNQAFDQTRAVLQAGGGNPKEAVGKILALRKRLAEKIVSELTGDQEEAWAEMLGAPFVAAPDAKP